MFRQVTGAIDFEDFLDAITSKLGDKETREGIAKIFALFDDDHEFGTYRDDYNGTSGKDVAYLFDDILQHYLQEKDLKTIMKSKDVPSPVSTHARRILQKKGKI